MSSGSNNKEKVKPVTADDDIESKHRATDNAEEFTLKGLDKLTPAELAEYIMPSDERHRRLDDVLPLNDTIQMKLAPVDVGRLEDSAHFSDLQNGTCQEIQELNKERCRIALLVWGQLLCDKLHACFLDQDQLFALLKRMEADTKPGLVAPGAPVCLFDICTGGEPNSTKNPERPQLIYLGNYELAKRTLLKHSRWIHAEAMKTWQRERDAVGPKYGWPEPGLLNNKHIARPGRIASGQEGSAHIAMNGPSPNRTSFRQSALAVLPEPPNPYPCCVLPPEEVKKK